MRSIIYKNYKKDVNEFNFSELKIKKVILGVGMLYSLIKPAYEIYSMVTLLRFDFGYTGIDGVRIENITYNLHLLSL
jgi:hypothetical protein